MQTALSSAAACQPALAKRGRPSFWQVIAGLGRLFAAAAAVIVFLLSPVAPAGANPKVQLVALADAAPPSPSSFGAKPEGLRLGLRQCRSRSTFGRPTPPSSPPSPPQCPRRGRLRTIISCPSRSSPPVLGRATRLFRLWISTFTPRGFRWATCPPTGWRKM